METNNIFSFQRLMLLGKQSMIINKKLIGISLAGFTGIVFFGLILLQSAANFTNWDSKSYMTTFIFLFFQVGLIYSGFSFPAFRSKEKRMTYLMLPASASEKFIFELLSRIILYIFFMPLLFWAVSSIEGYVIHYFVPGFTQLSFAMGRPYWAINNVVSGWTLLLLIQGGLFIFIASFTGASYFSKSPLLKTLFTYSMIVAGYSLFGYILFKGLNIIEYHGGKNVFFMDKDDAFIFGAIAITVINLSLLAVSWFNLKEKEA